MNIFVIGCGRWGSLITWYLDHIGHHVTLYGRQSSPRMQSFLATRQNDLLTLPDSVGLTTDLRDVEQAETVIISIGSQSLRSLLAETRMQALRSKTVVLCMKGLEMGTGERLSVIAGSLLHGATPWRSGWGRAMCRSSTGASPIAWSSTAGTTL